MAALTSSFIGLTATTAKMAGVSNGSKVSMMNVWQPNNNKFFETLSFLPPLSQQDIAKQIQYIVGKGWTPCLEFAAPEVAMTVDTSTFPGSYIRVAGFDSDKQVQQVSFIVHRPPGYEQISTTRRSV
eukprot:CAMPEP_0198229802 /NCGR_PEP_ID=MMETSP1445-20131203/114309_1 /TAXON_ID=36898 /ORGANISM="Pyramimonas sp., Strain CCMP2087" /LENGTH=126 /DNA_ID=CAMNT_0043910277 /DNA_START=140 /DNA_END=520 /DNA_ORIENTATION=+